MDVFKSKIQFKKNLMVPIFLFGFAGCGGIKTEKIGEKENTASGAVGESPIVASPPSQKIEVAEKISKEPPSNNGSEPSDLPNVDFVLQPQPVPHQYQIHIKWSEQIRKVRIEDGGRLVFESKGEQSFIYNIKDGSQLQLRVFGMDSGAPILYGTWEKEVPRDYTIEGVYSLSKDLIVKAHRVFLENKAYILTNGFKVKIETDQFFAEEAVLESFTKDTTAGPNQSGRNGGSFHLKSKEAFGRLQITMRGEHGGAGADGAPFGGRAATGSPGREGSHSCHRVGLLGPIFCSCDREPTKGGQGSPGAQGNPGSPGGNGGNSGEVIVQIFKKTNFIVDIHMEIGLGGYSGRGSPGQLGGLGGPSGNPTSDACRSERNGPNGADGQPGVDAPPSHNGQLGVRCISLGDHSQDCVQGQFLSIN